jgi:hypothetical protein
MLQTCSETLVLKIAVVIFCGSLIFLAGWLAALSNQSVLFNLHHCPRSDASNYQKGVLYLSSQQEVDASSLSQQGLIGRLQGVILFTDSISQPDLNDRSSSGRQGKGYRMERERTVHPAVLDQVFYMVHQPASPMTSEILLYRNTQAITTATISYNDICQEVYLTRTGSLANMPNKCLAVGFVLDDHSDPIPHTVRLGTIAHLTDMFSHAYADNRALVTERKLLPPLLLHLNDLSRTLRDLVGNTQDTILVMVLNTGVLDLFLNFLCSCKQGEMLDSVLTLLVVFTAQQEVLRVLTSLGVKAFHSPHLSQMPADAAGAYGDDVFGMAMWLKSSAVYLAAHAGYHVLFQDVDMVWMEDPLPHLQAIAKTLTADLIFMDVGARTPRFSPYYFNSGFYYVKHSARSVFLLHRMLLHLTEISRTHSHQSTLTNVLLEASELTPLRWHILDQFVYASGYLFHHNIEYIDKMRRYEVLPKVFHMCWTESRKQKVSRPSACSARVVLCAVCADSWAVARAGGVPQAAGAVDAARGGGGAVLGPHGDAGAAVQPRCRQQEGAERAAGSLL